MFNPTRQPPVGATPATAESCPPRQPTSAPDPAMGKSTAAPPSTATPVSVTAQSSVDDIEPVTAEASSSESVTSEAPKGKQYTFDPSTVFNMPQRKPIKVNLFKATFNVIFAFSLTGMLITGYIIGLKLVDFGVTSIGLYGLILVSTYVMQLTCALFNRYDIERIAKKMGPKTVDAQEKGKADSSESVASLFCPDGEVAISVIGYREDEDAYRNCLRSCQAQTLRPRCVVGVVDGNEQPDLDMANVFADEFSSYRGSGGVIHLPVLLSDLHRRTYFDNLPEDKRFFLTKMYHWLVGGFRTGHEEAMAKARQVVIQQVMEWEEQYKISSMSAVCFSQPHGHKRTALFTAWAMAVYAIGTRDGIFTTDSDTLLEPNAMDELLMMLNSSPRIAGVVGDMKIWNRADTIVTRLCAARYWFAFNIERACQSLWRCLTCLSGPMSIYRACDLETVLGEWNVQTFAGQPTTFGDDRHMTNQLLSKGLHTRYTHRTWCHTESPRTFVRWVTQQTRWTKSFFREAFWFPKAFVYQNPWLLLEMTMHTFYPFILIAAIFNFMFNPNINPWSPVVWLGMLFGVALFKSLIAFVICRDPWVMLFVGYGVLYFFGLLPTKIYALLTTHRTTWGTGARSSSEVKKGVSFRERTVHVIHLVIWFPAIFVGLGFFFWKTFGNPLYLLIGVVAIILTFMVYSDVFPRPWKRKD